MKLFLKFPVVTILLPIFFQKPGLSQKECLYLKKAIPMLVYRTERQITGPRFKSIAIQTETQITGKGNKEYIFPMACAFCSKRSTCKADNQEWTVSFGKEARIE